MRRSKLFVIMLGFVLLFPLLSKASSELKAGAPKIYLDCHWCSMDYIRENITFVNFVRDRKDADIHIFMSRMRTGSGGREYSLIFIGKNRFAGIKDTLKYYTNKTDTDKSKRLKMLKKLKAGLFRFFYKTEYANNFDVIFTNRDKNAFASKPAIDPWNFWVFRTSLSSWLSGEKARSNISVYGSLSASRVTKASKVGIYLGTNYIENNFNYSHVNVQDIKRSQNLYAYYTKSINEHWSGQIAVGANSSTYKNIDISTMVSAGLEYDFYPYSIATNKRAVIRYRIAPKYNNYSHITIYNKKEEYLLSQSISALVKYIEDWGTVSFKFSFNNYFHDFSKNSAEISTDMEFKLFKGLSLSFEGDIEAIHNQIELSAEEASTEDVLLLRRELETQYDYFVRVGFSYTFGSIFNNIVNPRFEEF